LSEWNHRPPEGGYGYTEPNDLPPAEKSNFGRIALILVLTGILLLLSWVGLKAFRVYQSSQDLLSLQPRAEALLAGGLSDLDPDAAVALVNDARADIVTLNKELAFLGPLAPVLGGLPQVGPLAAAAPHLLAMADAGSEAAALAADGLASALAIIRQDGFGTNQIGDLLPLIQQATPQLTEASAALARYSAARADLETAVAIDDLSWRVRQLLATADELVPAAEAGLRLAPQLPLLLGMNGPQRYLIMAQNEDELRPTGGFLTGAGVLTVENGRILDLSLSDANSVDDWANKPYTFPPQPYYDFMLAEMFLFRDANFWPDFPTSARQAMDLYSYGRDTSGLSGAVALDQEFLRLLVEATGPIEVGDGRVISADTLIRTLQQARDPDQGEAIGDWVGDRKAFLAGFAGAILSRVETDFAAIDPVKLARNMVTALDEHHLQLYLPQSDAAALAAAGWDGSLPAAPPGDFWMVVDTNMGFNKVNIYIDRAFDYAIDLSDMAAPRAQLVTTYTHSGQPTGEPCYQGVEAEFEAGSDYLSLADKCYWNYVRAYLPTGSFLLDSSRHVVPAETLFSGQTWDSTAQPVEEPTGLATFANFMLLPQGETAKFSLLYTLPAGVVQPQADGTTLYELRVNKQAGTRPEPLAIRVTLPQGAELVETSPSGALITGNVVTFESTLESNTILRLRFR
jgi:hypothetical protein